MPNPTLAEALKAIIDHAVTVANAHAVLAVRLDAIDAKILLLENYNPFDGNAMSAELSTLKEAVDKIGIGT